MTVSSTPEGVSVQPRHLHFDVSEDLKVFWHGDDAFRTAFFNALSLQFPDGEQQFINAVRLYRDRIDDPKLKAEIRGFIGQEALHSREHKAYNEALKARGYDIDGLERRFHKHMEWVGKLAPSRQLAGTCGAEHYTAVLANAILSDPEWLSGATPAMAQLWRWHAIEETEHKSVAFDVYRECVGNERMRRIIFLFVTWNFFKYTFLNTCSLLKTDGKLWSLRTWMGGLNFLWGKPGILRQCLPGFLAYFRKDFHPWQQDNRVLLEKNLQDLDAAV
ncbi:MAG: metal-dependent hydrolase [Oceanospirillales bacterium]|uniref:metal-dependent hydrolase n=1 Tax=Marinobacter maritimus TaxID=277961 RepID=UPI000BDA244D|nr:metal-dependent hydrolase [Marinobacter maritimus]MBL1272802.1 metal-dependent hydrolase [Oceanospirillales bacterium]|tara:strand:- start:243 stop:1067 length:825 start_codon:yes stop_codon:yes gene_type:complete